MTNPNPKKFKISGTSRFSRLVILDYVGLLYIPKLAEVGLEIMIREILRKSPYKQLPLPLFLLLLLRLSLIKRGFAIDLTDKAKKALTLAPLMK